MYEVPGSIPGTSTFLVLFLPAGSPMDCFYCLPISTAWDSPSPRVGPRQEEHKREGEEIQTALKYHLF